MKLFEKGKNNWVLKTGDREVPLDISESKGCCQFTKAVIKGAEYISNDSRLTERVLNIFDQHKYTSFTEYLTNKDSEKIDDYETEKHKEALNNIISLFDGNIKSYIRECLIFDINYNYSEHSTWGIFVSSFNKNVAPFLIPIETELILKMESNEEKSILKIDDSEMVLKAIFFSDIVDSTSYADENDYLYKDLQTTNRQIHKKILSKYNGEVIKDLGDGIMATFPSVKSSVSASIELMNEVISTNRYQLRIGVHLGDVRIELNDIQGINVNKTFRIQPKAMPNSICISEEVYRNIKNVPEFQCTFIGNEKLKGISGIHLLYKVEIDDQIDKFIDKSLPPVNDISTEVALSENELILIKEAVLSERCNIIKVRHQQGLVIQVDEKVLFQGDNPRKMAEWEDIFEKLLSDGLINKKGNQSFTLSLKGFEIGDKLVKKSEYGIKYDAQDNAFISITKIEFFLRRIQDAFPGVRELTWFNNPIDIINRLGILLRWPLEFYPINQYGKISGFEGPEELLWWFRGGSQLAIETFKKLADDKCLIGSKELKVSKLAVCLNSNDKKTFIYLQVHGEESVFSQNSNKRNGETEEYAIFDGHIITREEYDDGSALINGKVVSTDGRAKLRYRHLKPYNFIICSKSSDYNAREYNQYLRNFLDHMLSVKNIEEIFDDHLESLIGLNIDSQYRGSE